MRVLHISPLYAQPVEALPTQEPMTGFYWVSCTRAELESQLPAIQHMLTQIGGSPLVDLHVSDLLNPTLPSNYDYTSVYDILVFRRLANAHLPPLNGTHETIAASAIPASPATSSSPAPAISSAPASHRPAHTQPAADAPVLQRVETQPVGFALYDHVLLSVHPDGCFVMENFWQRLISGPAKTDGRQVSSKMPVEPADLMLRMVNGMVDGYLDLRRTLTRQIDHWQMALLKPNKRFSNWASVLPCRTGRRLWKAGHPRAHPPASMSASCCACAHATCWST